MLQLKGPSGTPYSLSFPFHRQTDRRKTREGKDVAHQQSESVAESGLEFTQCLRIPENEILH